MLGKHGCQCRWGASRNLLELSGCCWVTGSLFGGGLCWPYEINPVCSFVAGLYCVGGEVISGCERTW